MPKFIVIDGTDGSGKATQALLVKGSLEDAGFKVKMISFPNYESKYSVFVKGYLAGEFGDKATDISPHIASMFYALDRYAAWITELRKDWNEFDYIIADRYVSSNMIHQASKLDESEIPAFAQWLEDLEHNKLGMPKPDKVIFLCMPRDTAERISAARPLKNGCKKDIHEENKTYMQKSFDTAVKCSKMYGWDTIYCVDSHMVPLSPSEIKEKIINRI